MADKGGSYKVKEYIEQICKEYATTKNFSGVCLLSEGGQTIFEGAYGYANRAYRIPNTCTTRFDTASITKLFTAVAIMQLVEQNRIRLTDRITELIQLEGTRIPNDVTIEQLLNHTSGIADDAEEEAGEEYSDLFVDSPNYALKECSDFLKNFAYKEANFKAGTDVRYCNCSFILLGLVIEKISGKSYREYVEKNIFMKANMLRTGFLGMDEINEETAEGYKSIYDDNGKIVSYKKNIYSFPPKGSADSGAYTTVGDLYRFICAIKESKLLTKQYSDLMLHPHCNFEKSADWYEIDNLYRKYGYGFEFFMIKGENEPFCIYKDGQNDGVSAKISYYPKLDMCLVLLSNQDCNVWEMTKLIQLELYRRYYL